MYKHCAIYAERMLISTGVTESISQRLIGTTPWSNHPVQFNQPPTPFEWVLYFHFFLEPHNTGPSRKIKGSY